MYEQERVVEQERLEEIVNPDIKEEPLVKLRSNSYGELPQRDTSIDHRVGKRDVLSSSSDNVESLGYKFSFLGDTEFAHSVHDPHIQALHTSAMRWIGSEVKMYVLYNAVVLVMRAQIAGAIDVDFTAFVEGYVQAYTTAILKGMIF